MIRACLRAVVACLPFASANSVREDMAEFEAVIAARSVGAAMAAVEAAEFVERDTALGLDRFPLLALSLDLAIARDRASLAAVEAIEAEPRPQGRGQGLEWAYGQLFVDADRLRQTRDLLRALAPHEATIRALVSAPAREV